MVGDVMSFLSLWHIFPSLPLSRSPLHSFGKK